jgi:ribosome-interacting GTPase 1
MELDRFRALQSKFEALEKQLAETQDLKAQAVIFAEVRQIIAEMKELIDSPQSHRLNKLSS